MPGMQGVLALAGHVLRSARMALHRHENHQLVPGPMPGGKPILERDLKMTLPQALAKN